MLRLKIEDLNDDARIMVQVVCVMMLKHMAVETKTTEKGADSEEEPVAE